MKVWQTGAHSYGQSVWHHELSCGHIEQRKRKAPASEVGCLRCEAFAELDVVSGGRPAGGEFDRAASLDVDVAVLRVELASGLRVPADAVSLQVVNGRLQGALVILDLGLIGEILAR